MSRKTVLAMLAMTMALGAAPATAATAVGATRIEISSAIPTWIQIDEIEAIEFGSLTNVAAALNGGSASATSSGFGTIPAGAIDGLVGPLGYHSGSPSGSEILTLTLAHASSLTSLRFYGHLDSFAWRNVFNYSVFNAANDLLTSGVVDATSDFPAVIAFDDPPSTGGVPEPGAWALMILGFGAAGSALRRRVSLPV